jgi:CRISPR-associated protein Cas2
MFIILVYDIEVPRCSKALKVCRKYLNWVQNSVFEGEITEANLTRLKMELGNLIDSGKDSVIIYKMRTLMYTEREIMGLEKGGEELIL